MYNDDKGQNKRRKEQKQEEERTGKRGKAQETPRVTIIMN